MHTSQPTPTSDTQVQQPMTSGSKGGLIAVIIALVILLMGGVGAYAYYMTDLFTPKDPYTFLAETFQNQTEVQYEQSNFKLSVSIDPKDDDEAKEMLDAYNVDTIDAIISGEVRTDFSGATDRSQGSISLDSALAAIDLEYVSTDRKEIYVKLNNLSADAMGLPVGIFVNPFLNKWIFFSLDEISDLTGYESPEPEDTEADAKEIGRIFIETKPFIFTSVDGDSSQYTYRVTIDPVAANAFVKELADADLETFEMAEFSAEDLEDFLEIVKELDELDMIISFDKKTKLLGSFIVHASADDIEGVAMDMNYEMFISRPAIFDEIIAPKGAKSIEDVFAELMGGMMMGSDSMMYEGTEVYDGDYSERDLMMMEQEFMQNDAMMQDSYTMEIPQDIPVQ